MRRWYLAIAGRPAVQRGYDVPKKGHEIPRPERYWPPRLKSVMLLPLRLSLFYAAYFLVIGIQLPFWPLWLEGRGLTAAEIGVVLSVALWVRIVTIPVAGVVVDRTGGRGAALIVLSGSSLAASLLYLPIGGFWPILLVTVLVSACFSPVMNLGDNLTLLIARAKHLDYGRMRLWGSMSFIAAAGFRRPPWRRATGRRAAAVSTDRRYRLDGRFGVAAA